MWVRQKHYKAIGDALAAARTRAGVTQQQLAMKLGKPQSFISNYERGQRRLDVLELVLVVETLGGDPRKVFADILARRAGTKGRQKG